MKRIVALAGILDGQDDENDDSTSGEGTTARAVPHSGWRHGPIVLGIVSYVALLLLLAGLAGIGRNLMNTPSASASDPTIMAAGDIACDSLRSAESAPEDGAKAASDCQMNLTANLLVREHPAAVLPLGDDQYTNGALQEFERSYDTTWGRVKAITHPVPGNHEYLTRGARGYYDYFGEAAGSRSRGYYSFDLGRWHLVALNSNCAYIGGCGPGSPEVQWLRADLAQHHNVCTLAYWHHPRFSSGEHGNDLRMKPLWDVLYRYHADVVLNGHDHDYERFALQNPSGLNDPRGLREFVVGTGGASHYSLRRYADNSEVFNAQTYGVLKLTLHADSYDWQFLPVAGGTFADSGTDSCHR